MRMVSFAFAGVEPEVMGIGPIPSTEKALRKAGLTIDDIGLFELNEAFAVQVLSLLDHFGIDDEDPRVNLWGGAIAIGHPLAASRRAPDDPTRPPVRGAPRGALRLDRHVRRPRPGRKRHLGEPALPGSEVRRMTTVPDYSKIDFAQLVALDPDEVVTHSFVKDIRCPAAGCSR